MRLTKKNRSVIEIDLSKFDDVQFTQDDIKKVIKALENLYKDSITNISKSLEKRVEPNEWWIRYRRYKITI